MPTKKKSKSNNMYSTRSISSSTYDFFSKKQFTLPISQKEKVETESKNFLYQLKNFMGFIKLCQIMRRGSAKMI